MFASANAALSSLAWEAIRYSRAYEEVMDFLHLISSPLERIKAATVILENIPGAWTHEDVASLARSIYVWADCSPVTTHYFKTSMDAYNATQWRDDIATGDTLVCADGVVGVAETWPFAVTAKFADLHATGNVGMLLDETDVTRQHIRRAVGMARAMGLPVAPIFDNI